MPLKRKHKEFKIVINGTEHSINKRRLSFDEIVALGFDQCQAGSTTTFTITYRNGPRRNEEGTVDPDCGYVRIKEGMIFNVSKTDKS